MGRHSAPDDGSDPSEAPTVVLEAVRASRAARHSHAAADDADEAEVAEPVEMVADGAGPAVDAGGVRVANGVGGADGAAGSAATAAPDTRPDRPRPTPRPEGATHADLRLLRENPALRARCAAAVVVPFLLYTVVMIVLGSTAIYLVWVWVPTVLAGVTVGTFLDVAHRRES